MIEQAVKNAIKALTHYSALVDKDDEASQAVRAIAGLTLAMEVQKESKEKIMSVSELKDLWNSQADHMNQWDSLGLDEIITFAQTKK